MTTTVSQTHNATPAATPAANDANNDKLTKVKNQKGGSESLWKKVDDHRDKIGYLPVIGGQIAGIRRIYTTYQNKAVSKDVANRQYARGVAEIFGLGLFLALIDGVKAVLDSFKKNKTTPASDKVASPANDKVAPPAEDKVAPKTDKVAPETDKVTPETDKAAPETDKAAPEEDKVPPAEDKVTPAADETVPAVQTAEVK